VSAASLERVVASVALLVQDSWSLLGSSGTGLLAREAWPLPLLLLVVYVVNSSGSKESAVSCAGGGAAAAPSCSGGVAVGLGGVFFLAAAAAAAAALAALAAPLAAFFFAFLSSCWEGVEWRVKGGRNGGRGGRKGKSTRSKCVSCICDSMGSCDHPHPQTACPVALELDLLLDCDSNPTDFFGSLP
jgi:hypothetical protein